MASNDSFSSGLNKWALSDRPEMEDFVEDNRILDNQAMWRADYDADGAVADAGGIAGYVRSAAAAVSINGTFGSVAQLQAVHPIGSPGDGYMVDNELYVWDTEASTWAGIGPIGGQLGMGMPAGGNFGQVLKKASENDYDTVWSNENGGEGTGDMSRAIYDKFDRAEDVFSYADALPTRQPNFCETDPTSADWNELPFGVIGPLHGWEYLGTGMTFVHHAYYIAPLVLGIETLRGHTYLIDIVTETSSDGGGYDLCATDNINTISGALIRKMNHPIVYKPSQTYPYLCFFPAINWNGAVSIRIFEMATYNSPSLTIKDDGAIIANNESLYFGGGGKQSVGEKNCAYGYGALERNVTGSSNVAVGNATLANILQGSDNTAIGESAGAFLANGHSPQTVADNSLFLGAGSMGDSADCSNNQIVIGAGTAGHGSDTVTLGNNSIRRIYANVTTITALSDTRLKEDIQPANLELCYADVKRLPISRYKYRDFAGTHLDTHVTGFLADDVEKVFPKSVSSQDRYFPVLDKSGAPERETVYRESKTVMTREQYEALYGQYDAKKNAAEDISVREVTAPVEPGAKLSAADVVRYEVTRKVPHEVDKTFLMEKVKDITMTEAVPTLWGAVQRLMENVENLMERVESLETDLAAFHAKT